MSDLVVLGAGGLAREVQALASQSAGSTWTTIGLVDTADEDAALSRAANVVIGVGSPAGRSGIEARWGASEHLTWPVLRHENASLGPHIELGRGVGVQAGCALTTDIEVGDFTYLNLLVTLGHDVRVGRCCLLNPSVNVSGGVTIGDGVLLGVGAVVLEGLTIHSGAVVGAGAVVTKDVAADETVVGVPAKPLRRRS